MQNPLHTYRRTQRELRRHFESFTLRNCPTCPTPCCRRPARILPTDIMLAEAAGWKDTVRRSAGAANADMVAETAGRIAAALHDPPESAEAEPDSLPCEYLGDRGCTFPIDLRPFGCTAYICRYMHAQLDRPALTKIKRLVRELEEHHRALLQALHSSTRSGEQE